MLSFGNKIKYYFELMFSILGFVPRHATVARIISMISAVAFSSYLAYFQEGNWKLSLIYFISFEILYIGFIYGVLSEGGYRHLLIRKFGEERGYLIFEGILGFIFFNNGASITYIATTTSGNLLQFIPREILFIIVGAMLIVGFGIKLFAAKATSIDIYYWKDMFLGRKISNFVTSGPYKYFKNPMYGVGQLQAYAAAVWCGSIFGLLIAAVNQILVFSFYYLEEKKFIKRVYLKS